MGLCIAGGREEGGGARRGWCENGPPFATSKPSWPLTRISNISRHCLEPLHSAPAVVHTPCSGLCGCGIVDRSWGPPGWHRPLEPISNLSSAPHMPAAAAEPAEGRGHRRSSRLANGTAAPPPPQPQPSRSRRSRTSLKAGDQVGTGTSQLIAITFLSPRPSVCPARLPPPAAPPPPPRPPSPPPPASAPSASASTRPWC